jgi:hypothetical protein
LNDILIRIKYELPHINRAYIRSDNAGCYHSAQMIIAASEISKISEVNIFRWDFSDPQEGKGPCDRMAAVVKRIVKFHIDEDHRCTSAEELVKCMSSNQGITATSVIIWQHRDTS